MKNVKELQSILSPVRRAVQHYDMISEGDTVAVGVSGGKDSVAMLVALSAMRRFYPKKYDVKALTVDSGFVYPNGMTFDDAYRDIKLLCDELGVEFVVERTQIYDIVFNERKEGNPCSLCASMRRGALVNATKKYGCNKLSLGHHMDDVVETFMMNLMHEGRIGCFSPVTDYENMGVSMIRPLVYCEEGQIKAFIKKAELPVVSSPCPEDGHTERQYMHDYMSSFTKDRKALYRRVFGALERRNIDGWKE